MLSKTNRTSQAIDNLSFDEDFFIKLHALVKYDDPANPTSISRVNPATEAKQDDIITQITTTQPRDISKQITLATYTLNSSGNVKVPTSGKKLRIYSVQFSLSIDMTDISFRFTSAGTDFAKFLAPKTGGYYGINMNNRYFDGGIDQPLYCVINGSGNVQINVNYIEV